MPTAELPKLRRSAKCPIPTAARSRRASTASRTALCLTLGALAELEAAFGHEDMLALAERFQSGRLSARDAVRIIGAGLRGAGHDIADEAVAAMQADGGAAGFVDIVARLLAATFGGAAAVSDPSCRRQADMEGLTPLRDDASSDAVRRPAKTPSLPRCQTRRV